MQEVRRDLIRYNKVYPPTIIPFYPIPLIILPVLQQQKNPEMWTGIRCIFVRST